MRTSGVPPRFRIFVSSFSRSNHGVRGRSTIRPTQYFRPCFMYSGGRYPLPDRKNEVETLKPVLSAAGYKIGYISRPFLGCGSAFLGHTSGVLPRRIMFLPSTVFRFDFLCSCRRSTKVSLFRPCWRFRVSTLALPQSQQEVEATWTLGGPSTYSTWAESSRGCSGDGRRVIMHAGWRPTRARPDQV